MKFARIVALTVVASTTIFFSCSRSHAPLGCSAKNSANLKTAPDFTLKDANGATVKLSDYHCKVVILNFWATWCGPCKVEIPWFMEFEQQYKNKGFAVLGVAMDDDGWNVVKPYIAERKMNYRVVLGNDSVATAYGGVDSLPTTFVINQDGKIVTSHIGLVNKDEYQKEIQTLLDNASATNLSLPRALVPAFVGGGASR